MVYLQMTQKQGSNRKQNKVKQKLQYIRSRK